MKYSVFYFLFRTSPFILFFIFSLFPHNALSSTSDGTIDTTNKWAWSETVGWIDFGTTDGNVHVTNSALTGYAYGENIGWISLNCSNTSSCGTNDYAVSNTSSGTLSGYAWSETVGWINFSPTGGGVSINSSGVFTGHAYGENIGWIVFATDHPVTTDWRGDSTTTTTQSIGNGPIIGGIYGLGYVFVNPNTIPTITTPLSPTPSNAIATTSPQKFNFTKNLKTGNRSEDVKNLQKFLNTNGFTIATTGAGSPGNETTFFGALTRSALIKFQKSKNIQPWVGYFGPITRAYINNNY